MYHGKIVCSEYSFVQRTCLLLLLVKTVCSRHVACLAWNVSSKNAHNLTNMDGKNIGSSNREITEMEDSTDAFSFPTKPILVA